MLNERDEQHYEHEESEYHFSDDDISYEVETEASKPTAVPDAEKTNPLGGLTKSKRMIISLGVFLGLVFVVYKMVSPDSSVPTTDISPVVATQSTAPEIAPPPLPHTQQSPAPAPSVASAGVVPTQTGIPQEAPAPTGTPASAVPTTTVMTTPPTSAPAPVQPVAATPQPAPVAAPSTQPVAAPVQPSIQPVPAAPVQPAAPSTQPPAPVGVVSAQGSVPQGVPTPVAAAPSAVAPAMQVQAPIAQQPLPVATTVVTTPAVTPANTDQAIAAMVATNEKLMNQLQAEYSQKVTDFSNQNRALQDQMQTLSSRVAGLESQLTQLVQTLSRQTGMGGTTSLNVVPAQQPPPPIVEAPKVTYNVQAIIPGRAWLKSDNGETLTVAEGDTIRELGRVTKIDPYDGVVEVNTGSRTVSISYGSGG